MADYRHIKCTSQWKTSPNRRNFALIRKYASRNRMLVLEFTPEVHKQPFLWMHMLLKITVMQPNARVMKSYTVSQHR